MKKKILIIGFLFLASISYSQKSVKIKYSGVADTQVSVVSKGLVNKEISFVKNPSDADLTVYITKVRNNQKYTIERYGSVDETIRIKGQTSFYDHQFKLIPNSRANLKIYIAPIATDADVIISTYKNLSSAEIVATLYREINTIYNNKN